MGFKTNTLTAVDASFSGNLYASALTQAQTAYFVYYNPTSKQLTYDVSTGSGGGSGTIGGSIANDQVAIGAATSNNIEGSSALTYNSATGALDLGFNTDWGRLTSGGRSLIQYFDGSNEIYIADTLIALIESNTTRVEFNLNPNILLDLDGSLNVNGNILGANVTSGSNPGHTHTASSLGTSVVPASATDLGVNKDLNTYQTAGFYFQDSNADAGTGSNYPQASTAGSLRVERSAGVTQMYQTYNTTAAQLYFRSYYSSVWGAWRKVWTDANDGSGSGLDADLVDGIHGSSFLRSNAVDSATSLITFDAGLKLNDNDRALFGSSSDYEIYFTGAHLYIDDNGVTAGSDIKFTTAAIARFTFDMDTYKGTAVDWIASSDARLKENIVPYDNVLDKISAIKGSLVHFDWIDSGNKDVGAIAQELKPHFPEFVVESDADDNLIENQLSISYGKLSMVALEGIAELRDEKSIEILELKEKNKILESRLNSLESKLNILINK